MLRIFGVIIILFISQYVKAQLIRVGLFNAQKINHLKFVSKSGASFVFADTNFISKINGSDIVEFILDENSNINLSLNGKQLFSGNSFSVLQEKNEGFSEIKVLKPLLKPRFYEGDFFSKVVKVLSKLLMK